MSTPHPTAGAGADADAHWYRIRVHGHLDQRWAAWFDGLTLGYEGSAITVLEGSVADQAALHGLLAKIRDAGLPLISVTREPPSSS